MVSITFLALVISLYLISVKVDDHTSFMPPTLKKLKGHIGLALFSPVCEVRIALGQGPLEQGS